MRSNIMALYSFVAVPVRGERGVRLVKPHAVFFGGLTQQSRVFAIVAARQNRMLWG